MLAHEQVNERLLQLRALDPHNTLAQQIVSECLPQRARRNTDVVSLLPPFRQGTVVTCTDCHSSDDAPIAGGSGPAGPHGSRFEPTGKRAQPYGDGHAAERIVRLLAP